MPLEKRHWFRFAFRVKGSVIPSVLPRTIICGAFGGLISILHFSGIYVALPVLGNVIPSIVLGLMLVFRTNTAYERFWEGRRLWGSIIINVRNLARQIWVGVEEQTSNDHAEKIAAIYLLVVYAMTTKLHLRGEPLDEEVSILLSKSRYAKLSAMNNPPLEVAFWLSDYLQQQYRGDRLHVQQLTAMQQLVNQLVEALSGCERILKTPIPLAYAIHLKQLLLIYSLALPFQFVAQLGWWTAPVVALISFTLFGIEEIGVEIENPFGRDANDLPLDDICRTMLRNIQDLMSLSPIDAVSHDPIKGT